MMHSPLKAIGAVCAALALLFTLPGAASGAVLEDQYLKHGTETISWNTSRRTDERLDAALLYVNRIYDNGTRNIGRFQAKICWNMQDPNLDAIRYRMTVALGSNHATVIANTGAVTFDAHEGSTRQCRIENIPNAAGTLQGWPFWYATGYPFWFEVHGTVIYGGAFDHDFQFSGGDDGIWYRIKSATDPHQ
jgi:hypothetical protein